MKRFLKLFFPGFIAILAALLVLFCLDSKNSDTSETYTYEVINTFPHDQKAFTQGLVFENGALYEGTGLPGRSTLRKVELETGRVLKTHKLSPSSFINLNIKPEINNVAVLNDVIFSFEPDFAGCFEGLFAAKGL
ncbi:hypothetical protein ES703_53403 [subsurface metagenome]